MSDSINIVCPSCDAVNRIPSGKLSSQPNCGKCKQALFNAHPIELNSKQLREAYYA